MILRRKHCLEKKFGSASLYIGYGILRTSVLTMDRKWLFVSIQQAEIDLTFVLSVKTRCQLSAVFWINRRILWPARAQLRVVALNRGRLPFVVVVIALYELQLADDARGGASTMLYGFAFSVVGIQANVWRMAESLYFYGGLYRRWRRHQQKAPV